MNLSPPQRLTLLLDESPLNGAQRWLWVLSTGGTLLDGFVLLRLESQCPSSFLSSTLRLA